MKPLGCKCSDCARCNGTVARLEAQVAHNQYLIDNLMLEYCIEDMTVEQITNWADHQVISDAQLSLPFGAMSDAEL